MFLMLEEFLDSTTVHGFTYLQRKHPLFCRTIWVRTKFALTYRFPNVLKASQVFQGTPYSMRHLEYFKFYSRSLQMSPGSIRFPPADLQGKKVGSFRPSKVPLISQMFPGIPKDLRGLSKSS